MKIKLSKETKLGTELFTEEINRVEDNLVYLKGYRSPFTKVGDILIRNNQKLTIRK